jgi:poly(A) polymerase
MITNLINKLLGKPSATSKTKKTSAQFGHKVELSPEQHGIDPDLVDSRAYDVVNTLKRAGYEAYIVGGAVRDLLLGLRPKDFDVATSATPEQVKTLFRRAFIIGRRFRIVHVVYGRGREHEVVEVSTFRAFLDNNAAQAVAGNEKTSKSELAHMKHAVDSSGRVLRDNVWGPMHEDAARRDFTINAMYYDPLTEILVDYHKGIEDSKKRLIRMIGDPANRYREDPVRIIRAVRFTAKLSALGFKLEPKTAKPLVASQDLLKEVPQSRLFDEMFKLLQTGHSIASIEQLKQLKLQHGIYPLLSVVVDRSEQVLVQSVLLDTDRRVKEGRAVAPSFLLACVLWEDVKLGWDDKVAHGVHRVPALQEAVDEVFNLRIGDVSGRGKLASDMREIWAMQTRFEKRTGSGPWSLVDHPRYRAGFDFLQLRAKSGEIEDTLVDWWHEFASADQDLKTDMLLQVRDDLQKSKSKNPKSTQVAKPKTKTKTNEVATSNEDSGVENISPVKKRKRKPRRYPSTTRAKSDSSNGGGSVAS